MQARSDTETMARTKGKPGPKPKYGEREEIHVLVPVDDLSYIRSVTDNMTGWIIQAIQEKRQREGSEERPGIPGSAYRKAFTKSRGPIDRMRLLKAAEHILAEEEREIVNRFINQIDMDESISDDLVAPQQMGK